MAIYVAAGQYLSHDRLGGGVRDILLFALVFGSIPFILRSPIVGIYVWTWLSYMNPHRLTWGAAYDFPFAQLVAILVFVSVAANSKELRKPIINAVSVIWVLYIIWMCITTAAAIFPDRAWVQLTKILKIQLIIFMTMLLVREKVHIQTLVWITYLSLGFYGLKGGIFSLMTGLQFTIWGPDGSFIEDNNHLAVALLMNLPLGYYLVLICNRWYIKAFLWASLFFTFVSIVASYSRGAMVAIACLLIYTWWGSKYKFRLIIPFILILPIVFMVMPERWHSRMDTLENYEEDASAMGRINAWQYTINVASSRITGAGLESWSAQTFARWGAGSGSSARGSQYLL